MYGTSASATASMSASLSAPLSESVTRSSPSIQGNGYLDHVGNAEPLTAGSVDSAHFLEGIACSHEIAPIHNCMISFGIFSDKSVAPCYNGRISGCWKFQHYPYRSIKEA